MKKILLKSLQLQAQMRILHWQTTSFAEHNAFGGFYDAADDIIDKLITGMQARTKYPCRPSLPDASESIPTALEYPP